MGIVLDYDILISLERDKEKKFPEILKNHKDEKVFISAITASELLHGVWRAKDEPTQTKRQNFVEKLLSKIPIIDIDISIARVHAKLWAELAEKGEMIGIHNSWIAATCIALDFKLFSNNLKQFSRIKGLRVLNLGG